METHMPLEEELTDDELMELDRFLGSPGLVESSLDVFGLEGFLTAVLAGPRLVKPSEWTPWIWDVDGGEVSPDFENVEQAQRILGLVMRLYNSVARALLPGAGEFEPLFEDGDAEAGSNWCSGFLGGTRFEAEAWADLIDDKPKWFTPILGLGLEDDEAPRPRKGQLDRWTRDVGPAVTKIHGHWSGSAVSPEVYVRVGIVRERLRAAPRAATKSSAAEPHAIRANPARSGTCAIICEAMGDLEANELRDFVHGVGPRSGTPVPIFRPGPCLQLRGAAGRLAVPGGGARRALFSS